MEAISIRVPALLNHRDWDCEPLPLDQNCGRDLPSLPQCRSMRPYVPSHSVVQPQVPPVSSFFFFFYLRASPILPASSIPSSSISALCWLDTRFCLIPCARRFWTLETRRLLHQLDASVAPGVYPRSIQSLRTKPPTAAPGPHEYEDLVTATVVASPEPPTPRSRAGRFAGCISVQHFRPPWPGLR